MKVTIQLLLQHHGTLLKYANENSPAFSMLKNGVKLSRSHGRVCSEVIAIVCDQEQVKILRQSATHFCPEALPEIDKAIRFRRFARS